MSQVVEKNPNKLMDPLTVLNGTFDLLKHRFENTMDSYAHAEFARIERALEKLTQEIQKSENKKQ